MKSLIAYFHSSATAASMQKIAGVCHAAHDMQWSVLRFDIQSLAQIQKDIQFWQPAGCIVDAVTCSSKILKASVFREVPTVLIDCDPRHLQSDVCCLYQDAAAIARAAADELMRHELASYAFVPWSGKPFWSETRGAAFAEEMKQRGFDIAVFRPRTNMISRQSVIKHLAEWLPQLTLPVGIFTAADPLSEQILEAAQTIGLSIPRDIVVIGVDNDEFFCENTRPMLSSVSQDFENIGKRSVDILRKHIDNPSLPAIQYPVQTIRVVTRSSTRRTIKHDAIVSKSLDLIRERATSGISAAEVISSFPCSRRLAEQRFRAFTGHSIVDEIHAVQIEYAKKLAINPLQKLTSIPTLCGHTTAPYFQKLFLKEVGMTLSEYRANARREPHT